MKKCLGKEAQPSLANSVAKMKDELTSKETKVVEDTRDRDTFRVHFATLDQKAKEIDQEAARYKDARPSLIKGLKEVNGYLGTKLKEFNVKGREKIKAEVEEAVTNVDKSVDVKKDSLKDCEGYRTKAIKNYESAKAIAENAEEEMKRLMDLIKSGPNALKDARDLRAQIEAQGQQNLKATWWLVRELQKQLESVNLLPASRFKRSLHVAWTSLEKAEDALRRAEINRDSAVKKRDLERNQLEQLKNSKRSLIESALAEN